MISNASGTPEPPLFTPCGFSQHPIFTKSNAQPRAVAAASPSARSDAAARSDVAARFDATAFSDAAASRPGPTRQQRILFAAARDVRAACAASA